MSHRLHLSTIVWGVLSILAGVLMTEGGTMEVITYWSRETLPVVLGALGAIASATLLVSGVAFLTRRTFGRRAAFAAAIGMIPVHFAGWMLGIVGVPGALLGVAYPTILLVVMRARPNLGAPVQAERGVVDEAPPPSDRAGHSRSLMAAH
jgi:hypothetical protein